MDQNLVLLVFCAKMASHGMLTLRFLSAVAYCIGLRMVAFSWPRGRRGAALPSLVG